MGQARGLGGQGYYDSRPPPQFPEVSHPSIDHFSFPFSPDLQGSQHQDFTLYPQLVGEGICQRDPGTSTSLFLQDVYGPQTRRRSQTSNRPLRTQQATDSPKVQNGDSSLHLQGSLNPRLGDHNGLGGRLFESPRRSFLSKVSGLHSLRSRSQKIQDFPVSGYAVRPFLSAMGIHKNNQASKEASSHSRHSSPHLSRRFPQCSSLQLTSRSTDQLHIPTSPIARLLNKPQEIRSSSKTDNRVPGCLLGPTGSHSFTHTSKERLHSSKVSTDHLVISPLQTSVRKSSWLPQLLSPVPPTRQASVDSYYTLDESLDFSCFQGPAGSSQSSSQEVTQSVVERRFSSVTSSHPHSSPLSRGHGRRLPLRLVRCTSPRSNKGRMASRTPPGIHELEGTSSHPFDSGPLCPPARRKDGHSLDRQLDSGSLHSSSGLSPFSKALVPYQRTLGFLSSPSHYVSSFSPPRGLKCHSRQGFKKRPNQHGMGSRPGLLPGDLLGDRNSPTGSVCYKAQYPTLRLHLPLPRPGSPPQGCLFPRLERLGINLSVSTLTMPPTGCLPSPHLQRERLPDSPLLAISPLVRHAETQVSPQKAATPGTLPVPVHLPGFNSSPQNFRFEINRLDAIVFGLRAKGWSDRALEAAMAQHKASTCHQYQAIWRLFLSFLNTFRIPHISVNPQTAYNFLSHHCLVEDKQYKTIACYKSAIFHPLLFRLGVYIGRGGDLAEEVTVMAGLHRLKPPGEVSMPKWLLSDLLAFLRSPFFEPLSLASDDSVFAKSLVLLLLATGRRISEISGLARDYKETSKIITLRWVKNFTPKHWTQDFHPFSPSFTPLVGAQDDLLCPRRAYSELCVRRNVLVNPSNDMRLWMLSTQGLTKMFIDVVQKSLLFKEADPNIKIGPHQMRKLACSYNKKYFPKHEKKLFTKLGSKSMKILNRTYIRSVPDLEFSCVLPTGVFIATHT